MEATRAARSTILNVIKIGMLEDGTSSVAETPPADMSWDERMVLPPFLGEMGFEIRYFLAAVEPWLRNGWRIPAKRPEFYPAGTAFADPELFAEIADSTARYGAFPAGGALRIRQLSEPLIVLRSSIATGEYFTVSATCNGANDMNIHARSAWLETELRQAFARRYMLASRPITPWDTNLLASYDARPEHLCGGALSLAPSYKPAAFLDPPYPAQPHVGVQMRRLPHAADRDSDPAIVLAKAQEAATYLGLPLLVYGHPDGTIRPEGLPNTSDLAGDRPLLRYELSMLSQCRLMLAPESGWCDLMCWLQIPTLLEKLGRPHEFTHNRVFRPRLALLHPDQPMGPQIEALFAVGECLPTRPAGPPSADDMDWDGDWIRQEAAPFLGRP